MATLYVTEYSGASRGGQVELVPGRRLRKNNVAIGASSAVSNAFGRDCGIVRIAADVSCSFVFSQDDGVSPTVTATDQYMPAGGVEYFTVQPGDFIAVIQNP